MENVSENKFMKNKLLSLHHPSNLPLPQVTALPLPPTCKLYRLKSTISRKTSSTTKLVTEK
jgi:hypothetical protein